MRDKSNKRSNEVVELLTGALTIVRWQEELIASAIGKISSGGRNGAKSAGKNKPAGGKSPFKISE